MTTRQKESFPMQKKREIDVNRKSSRRSKKCLNEWKREKRENERRKRRERRKKRRRLSSNSSKRWLE